jgi:hypothetical protein
MPDSQWFLDRAVKCLALAEQLKIITPRRGSRNLALIY